MNPEQALLNRMSPNQFENLTRANIERMGDDDGLDEWLPDVADDVTTVEVGIWRCAYNNPELDDDILCDNAELWESPFDWEPECGWCGRKAFLVEYVGRFDFEAST